MFYIVLFDTMMKDDLIMMNRFDNEDGDKENVLMN